MNLNNVRLFIRVVEHNSFTAAAEKLGIQKSTISRKISQLEDELGVRLLQRTTRKLSLTDEGQALFERSQPLFSELDEVADHLTSRQDEPQGRLRITMPPEMGIFIMDEVVASFVQKYPLLKLDIELSSRVVDLVEEGIDLALRVGELSDSSLIGRKIASINIQVYASTAYLQQHGEPQTPEELKDHECIGVKLNMPGWIFTNWEDGKPVNLDFRISANNLSFCRQMLYKGLGIARMPRAFCQDALDRGEIKQILTDYHAPTVHIHALYPSRRHLNPKIRLFIDHMLEEIDGHHWFEE